MPVSSSYLLGVSVLEQVEQIEGEIPIGAPLGEATAERATLPASDASIFSPS